MLSRQQICTLLVIKYFFVSNRFSVYTGLAEAALCCAWSADGRVFVMGGEAGELHLLLPPSCPGTLHQETDAHDLGDFFSCTLYLAQNRGNLVFRNSILHFSPNSLWVVELKVALRCYQSEEIKIVNNYLEWESNPQNVAFTVTRLLLCHDWHQ